MKKDLFTVHKLPTSRGFIIDANYVNLLDGGWSRFESIDNEAIRDFILSNQNVKDLFIMVGGNLNSNSHKGVGVIASFNEIAEGIGAINKLLDGEASIDADGDKYIGWEVVCNDDVGEKLAEIFRSMFKLANHQKKSASNLH